MLLAIDTQTLSGLLCLSTLEEEEEDGVLLARDTQTLSGHPCSSTQEEAEEDGVLLSRHPQSLSSLLCLSTARGVAAVMEEDSLVPLVLDHQASKARSSRSTHSLR